MKRIYQIAGVLVIVAFFAMLATSGVLATKDLYNEAKEALGKSEVKGCKHCHVKALPKEGASDLNEVGKWLLEQKKERGAEAVDVSWLKEYKGK